MHQMSTKRLCDVMLCQSATLTQGESVNKCQCFLPSLADFSHGLFMTTQWCLISFLTSLADTIDLGVLTAAVLGRRSSLLL